MFFLLANFFALISLRDGLFIPPVLEPQISLNSVVYTGHGKPAQIFFCNFTAEPMNWVSVNWYRIRTGETEAEQLYKTSRTLISGINGNQLTLIPQGQLGLTDDTGEYYCEITMDNEDLLYPFKMTSEHVKLKKSIGTSVVIDSKKIEITVTAGRPTAFRDHIDNLPTISDSVDPSGRTTWQRNGDPVSLGKRIQLDTKGYLVFMQVLITDEGVYSQAVENLETRTSHTVQYYKLNVLKNRAPYEPSLKLYDASGEKVEDSDPIEYRKKVYVGEKDVALQCVFWGFAPSSRDKYPAISWSLPNQDLVVDIDPSDSQPSLRTIPLVEEKYEGVYTCTGNLDIIHGVKTVKIYLEVLVPPTWTHPNAVPFSSVNLTVSTKHSFRCKPYAKPEVESTDVSITVAGVKMSKGSAGPEFADYLQNSAVKIHPKSRKDTCPISCSVKWKDNVYTRYSYVNVVNATEIRRFLPDGNSVTLEKTENEFTLSCFAVADEILDVEMFFLKKNISVESLNIKVTVDVVEENGVRGYNASMTYVKHKDHTSKDYEGKYSCLARASNGNTAKKDWNVAIKGIRIAKPVVAAFEVWQIALVVIVLIIIIVVTFVICCYCLRRGGDTYNIDKIERAAGHDPEQEMMDIGYHDLLQPILPPDDAEPLNDIDDEKSVPSDDESFKEYEELDEGKFNEDGSFICQYGNSRPKRAENDTAV